MSLSHALRRALALFALAGLLAACGPASSSVTGPAGPGPFSALAYPDAQREAVAQGKLFFVDATAEWCPPCKTMERSTWPDPTLGAWLAQHAISVQVDVDKQPEIAQQLQIRAMPTLIIFRDGRELARREGGMSAADLLAWLTSAAS